MQLFTARVINHLDGQEEERPGREEADLRVGEDGAHRPISHELGRQDGDDLALDTARHGCTNKIRHKNSTRQDTFIHKSQRKDLTRQKAVIQTSLNTKI